MIMSSIASIAITALKAFQSDLQVTGNNIANSQTVGFKGSKASFADIYSTDLATDKQFGIGVKVSAVNQDFSQGSSQITGRNLDLEINGSGFFTTKNITSGLTTYTRAGQFQVDKNGFITQNGDPLQGYAAFNGVITTNLTNLQVNNAPLPATASTTASLQLNLDSTSTIPANAFSNTDPTSYNYRTDNVLYDSLGKPNNLTLFYIKTANNAWSIQMEANGTNIGTGTLSFSPAGALTGTTGLNAVTFNPGGGATSPQTFALNFTGTSQFAGSNQTRSINQDGYPSGVLTSYDFDSDGLLTAHYSNGQNQTLGQVAVAQFNAPSGLANVSNTSWIETNNSGKPILNAINSKGAINPGALELSNVDISQQLINLISAQNSFQANAQVVKTANSVDQTVLSIRQ
jgi:flagellar hook protein FlgE